MLEAGEFFDRERMDFPIVKLALLLYNCGVSLRRVSEVLGWMGVERSHVAVWTWIQKLGWQLGEAGRRPDTDLPAVCLSDETAISQHGEEFALFAAFDSETSHILHAEVADTKLPATWRCSEHLREL